MGWRGRRVAAVFTGAVTVAAAGVIALVAPQQGAVAAPPPDRTSAVEARRVDRVTVPAFDWFTCRSNGGQCATITLPLDYDAPSGAKVKVAVARVRAAKPKQRIGTLFVGPGGVGGSAVDLALAAPGFLDQAILDRFDVVGVDPRGTGHGDRVRCFRNAGQQADRLAGYQVPFPVTAAEQAAYTASARKLAAGCAGTGLPLAAAMSTAQVARDLDVVRRALGDKALTFLGYSYGTQLGLVYANLFPDRVRAIALDGVIDPVQWTTGRNGSAATSPTEDRLRAADGAYRALREYLVRCDRVGRPTCAFAGSGNSLLRFDQLAERLRAKPVTLPGPDGAVTFTYAGLVAATHNLLVNRQVGAHLAELLQAVDTASRPLASAAQRAAAARVAATRLRVLQSRPVAPEALGGVHGALPFSAVRDGFAYDNTLDAYSAVVCSDGVFPADPRRWAVAARAAQRRAPHFGPAWLWASNACAGSIWKARDEDRYLGPFTRRTAKPVLFVGNYYDPITSYDFGAVPAAKQLPNSRLLSSNAWGHTAHGSSSCVDVAVRAYLIDGTLPKVGALCTGPQPFPAAAAASDR